MSNKRANDLAVVAKQKSDIAVESAAEADRERKRALPAQKATEQALTQVASQKAEVERSCSVPFVAVVMAGAITQVVVVTSALVTRVSRDKQLATNSLHRAPANIRLCRLV